MNQPARLRELCDAYGLEKRSDVLGAVWSLLETFIEWLEAWDEHHIEPEAFLDRGDQVLATIHVTARGGHSGMVIDSHGIRYLIPNVAQLDKKSRHIIASYL